MIGVADARSLPIEKETVHLCVTSPPYNVGIGYSSYDDNLTMEDYTAFTRDWLKETSRVLVEGGRLCVNIANVGRKPYHRLASLLSDIAVETGFLVRGEIIWNKGDAVARGKTSWGSWCDCSNPVTRDCHEYVIVFSKGQYGLDCSGFPPSDITPTEFSDYTVSVWNITPKSVSWHPVPFPDEIPYRCIKLYTRPGMTVLDPFSGSGTTARVAKMLGRKFQCFDMDKEYVSRSIYSLGGNLFK